MLIIQIIVFFRWKFTPTDEEKNVISEIFGGDLTIPENFQKTAPGYQKNDTNKHFKQPLPVCNPQTMKFCQKLQIDDPLNLILSINSKLYQEISVKDEINQSLDLSRNAENTTFIDETVILDEKSLNNTIGSPVKLVLNLPQPVMGGCGKNLTDEEINETSSSNLIQKNDEISKKTSEIDKSFDENDKIEGKMDESTPMIKKFKRRNAEIYQDNEIN